MDSQLNKSQYIAGADATNTSNGILSTPGQAASHSITDDKVCSIVKDQLPVTLHLLEQQLQTSSTHGITTSQIQKSREQFGRNFVPQRPPTPFWKIYFGTFSDPTLIILLVAAVVSITLGFAIKSHRDELGYIDGFAIIVAILVVSCVSSINDFQSERQFRKLTAQKEARNIIVIRGSKHQEISVYDLVVGDILVLNQGDAVPADGVLCSTQLIKMDQSQMTGESDSISKNEEKPWIISGTMVSEGSGLMIVTAVGSKSLHGETMMALSEENEIETPLQAKLNFLVKIIGYLGMAVAAAIFIVLVIKFFVEGKHKNKDNFVQWVDFIILAITIIVVAIPEGLPLAVTISLAFSMKKMIKDQCLVRKLQSCETCGSISVICSDKTGTLTQNQMRVVKLYSPDLPNQSQDSRTYQKQTNPNIFEQHVILGCGLSTGCFVEGNKIVGNKTNGAFLLLSNLIYGIDYKTIQQGLSGENLPDQAVFYQVDFSSQRKRSNMIVDLNKYGSVTVIADCITSLKQKGQFVSYIRGASEIVLDKCTSYLTQEGEVKPIDQDLKIKIQSTIQEFAKKSLRTLILAYKPMNEVQPKAEDLEEEMEKDMTMIVLVGIQDPLRPGVQEAIRSLQHGGIRTIMVTGDNFDTAVAIAKDANILGSNISEEQLSKFAITGEKLRVMTDDQIDELVTTLCCVARCQPTDKYKVVQRLQKIGHVVAATGDGSNDAPQLKVSDVGLAMGIAGTEIAKEASDIIILDDNFVSIVQAVRWGRAIMANIRKFVQFQLTVNVVALVIAFLGAAVFSESPLTAIQLLYVNLIMDSLGSLALATEGPTANILDYKPVPRNAFIITPGMLRNVLAMSAYNLLVILLLMFEPTGNPISMVPNYVPLENQQSYRYTSIYNFFIFAQIFNEFSSRRIGNEMNVFQGLFKAPLFIIVIVVTIILQVIIMLVPGIRLVFKIFGGKLVLNNVTREVIYGITWETWLIDLALGFFGMVIHTFMRLIPLPDEYKAKNQVMGEQIAPEDSIRPATGNGKEIV